MPLGLASELWGEVKRYINTVDRSEAAETLVNVLIDNGFDGAEIKDAFKSDAEVKRIISAYMEDDQEEDEEYQEDDEEEDW